MPIKPGYSRIVDKISLAFFFLSFLFLFEIASCPELAVCGDEAGASFETENLLYFSQVRRNWYLNWLRNVLALIH